MEQLWAVDRAQTVREVHAAVVADRDLAYTTVMTVLDRLAKKKVVLRRRQGRAWLYRPAQSRERMVAEVMHTALTEAEASRSAALVEFVGQVTSDEADTLRRALSRLEEKTTLEENT